MKKTYYFKIVSEKKRASGGRIVVADVYEVKSGKINKMGEVKWDTGSFKGETSVVYDFLKDKKIITQKEYDENRGYYNRSKSKVNIESL